MLLEELFFTVPVIGELAVPWGTLPKANSVGEIVIKGWDTSGCG